MGRKIPTVRRSGGQAVRGLATGAILLAAGISCGERQPEGAEAAAAAAADSSAIPAILFLGTSLTAGYGVGEERAYPALIQQRLDSAGFRYRVVNGGVSGQTSAGGLAQLEWMLRQPVAVLVVELGANDGLRGQSVDSLAANLQAVIERTRSAHPDVRIVIAGMEAPPNLGPEYTAGFRGVFPHLARENDAELIPFLLEGVAAIDELNQPDGIHPTAEGHEIMARMVWETLQRVLPSPAR